YPRFRGGTEIVDMNQLQAGFEYLIGALGHGDLSTAPPAQRKFAQMPAALQPDSAQVAIQFLERRLPGHLQMQPEIASPGIFYLQMIEILRRACAFVGGGNRLQSLRTVRQ